MTQSSKEDVGKNQKRRAKGDGVDRVDETSSDDETDSDKETLNYKTKVDPTEKNISEIILRRKIFGDQVLFTSDSVSLSRDMLYNSFKKKGEISMEVLIFRIFFMKCPRVFAIIHQLPLGFQYYIKYP